MLSRFLPEGRRLETPENRAACASLSGLLSARDRDQILEGVALSCSPEHDLTVALGPFIGVIPRPETAVGVAEGTVRDIAILSRVGKPVCVLVERVMEGPDGPRLLLSRRRAQVLAREALMDRLRPGMVLPCTVTHLEPFGAFVDMGCGLVSMIGIEQISVSRIPHPACRFTVEGLEEADGALRPRLSRRRAQRAALDAMLAGLRPGMVIPAVVTHLEPFGAFVDIGCGVPSLIGIENISVSRIPHPGQRFRVGQAVCAAVLDLDPRAERIYLTHRELLGTWAENAARFQPGMTVPGIVRGVKDYGAFVELTPNLSGLAERKAGLAEGQRVSVYIKAILPERMKIKLLAIDTLPPLEGPAPLEYFITQGRLEKWKYAPPGCVKVGAETVFS